MTHRVPFENRVVVRGAAKRGFRIWAVAFFLARYRYPWLLVHHASPTHPQESLLMKLSRNLTLAVATASCVLALAACKPTEKDAARVDAKSESVGKQDTVEKIPGLATEKEQVSYMIGMDIGKSLKPMKDEIDMATVKRSIDDVFNDKKPLLDDEQAMKVMQAFGQRMQAKQQEQMAKKQAEMEAQGRKNIALEKSFLAGNAKKSGVVTTASGLQYQVITQGAGPKPKAPDSVSVSYVGTMLDGTEFDNSYARNEPAQFALNSVVPGWSEALQLMPVGSKYKLWVPAKLGYGETGTPGGPIPPNSPLIFEVELHKIIEPVER